MVHSSEVEAQMCFDQRSFFDITPPWQGHKERASSSQLRLDPHRALQARHCLLHDRQPDAGALVLLARVQPLEYLKDLRLVALCDPDPVIPYRDFVLLSLD